MTQRFLTFLGLFLLFAGLGTLAQAQVDIVGDPGGGNPYATISAALASGNVTAGDTLNITAGFVDNAVIGIDSLTIEGNGFTISDGSSNASPVIAMNAGITLTLNDVNTTGGRRGVQLSDDGCALTMTGGSISNIANHAIVRLSTTSFAAPATIDLTNVTINAVALRGINSNNNTVLNVAGSTITNCTADGLYVGVGSTATIDDTDFGGNAQTDIYFAGGTSTITNSDFVLSDRAQGFYLAGAAAVSFDTCTFDGAALSTMPHCNVFQAFEDAGPDTGASVTVANSSITANPAFGGPVRLVALAEADNSATFTNCTTSGVNRLAETTGIGTETHAVTFTDCTIDASAGVEYILFNNNAALTLTMANTDVLGDGVGNIGHFQAGGLDATLTGTTFNNFGFGFLFDSAPATPDQIDVDQCDFINFPNPAIWVRDIDNGGGPVVSNTVVNVLDSNFENMPNAVALFSDGATLTADSCVAGDNGAGTGSAYIGSGAATGATVTINNVVSADSVLYDNTVFGDADYLKLDAGSLGATLNSGNGVETWTGAKGVQPAIIVDINGVGNYPTLTAALAVATAGDTINVHKNFVDNATVSLDNLTINGNGNTISDGSGLAAALITVDTAVTLTVNNLNFTGGKFGIDVLADGTDLTVNGGVFAGADKHGIVNRGPQLATTTITIVGADIQALTRGINANSNTVLDVDGTTLTMCGTDGIFVGVDSVATVDGCTFVDNLGADIFAAGGVTTVANSDFIVADRVYGCFFTADAEVSFNSCTFDSTASDLQGVCTMFEIFEDTTAATSMSLTVTDSIIVMNPAFTGPSRLVRMTEAETNATFTGCTVSGINRIVDSLTLIGTETYNLTLTDCSIDVSGGAVEYHLFNNDGAMNLTMTGCDVIGDSAGNIWHHNAATASVNVTVRSTTFKDFGFGFLNDRAQVDPDTYAFDQCDFHSFTTGPGIWVRDIVNGGGSEEANPVITIYDTNFENMDNAAVANSAFATMTVEYGVSGSNLAGTGNAAIGAAEGATYSATNVLTGTDAPSVLYANTTFGDANYLTLATNSPGANHNSGNGPETWSGAKGVVPAPNAVENWSLYY